MDRRHFSRLATVFRWQRAPDQQPATNRGGKARRRRRLGFELCEDRRVLSGASITGTVFDTVSNSGFSAGDVPQAGVPVNLYLDNGDGTFNPSTDTRVDQQTSAVGTGLYTFGNVADGLYYIQEVVPSGYSQSAGPSFYTVDVVGGVAYSGDHSAEIDNFSDPNPQFMYVISALNPNPLSQSFTGPTSDIIGGQRDMTINVLGVANPISAEGYIGTVSMFKGVFNLGTASTTGTEAILKYDANGAGLGANLTSGGSTGFLLSWDFLQVGVGNSTDMEIALTSAPAARQALRPTSRPTTILSACSSPIQACRPRARSRWPTSAAFSSRSTRPESRTSTSN